VSLLGLKKKIKIYQEIKHHQRPYKNGCMVGSTVAIYTCVM
jgi:hypothetical protein